jgi:hypothetical protein
MKNIIAAIFLSFMIVSNLPAQSGWSRDKMGLYAKLGYSYLNSDEYFNGDGLKFKTAKFTQQNLLLYAEYGITKRFTAIINFPYLRSNGFDGSPSVKGVGDMMVELKYGVIKGKFPLSLSVAPEFPTGNPYGRAYDKYGGYTILPTGDGEFNVWTKTALSHSFYPLNLYASVYGGYNIRTMGFTNQYLLGAEIGYKFGKRLWTKIAVRKLGTAGKPNPVLLSAIGLGEGIEYNAYNLGLSYNVTKYISLTFDYSNGFGKLANIYGGNTYLVGIAIDINFKKNKENK